MAISSSTALANYVYYQIYPVKSGESIYTPPQVLINLYSDFPTPLLPLCLTYPLSYHYSFIILGRL